MVACKSAGDIRDNGGLYKTRDEISARGTRFGEHVGLFVPHNNGIGAGIKPFYVSGHSFIFVHGGLGSLLCERHSISLIIREK